MDSFNFDHQVLVFTETWLNDNFLNTEILCNNFNIFRRDRGSRNAGGGVLIAVAKELSSELIVIDPSCDIEFVAVSINLNFKRIFVTCSYIPPSSPQIIYMKHAEIIRTIASSSFAGDSVCCFGDFNLPSINWKYIPEEKYFLQIKQNSYFDEFFNILYDSCLFQINGISNIYGKILDLIFVNDVADCFISRSSPITSPEDSYHPTIKLNALIPSVVVKPSCNSSVKRFSFNLADYNTLIKLFIDTDWFGFFSCYPDVHQMAAAFYNKVYSFMDVCIPKKRIKQFSGPPWNNKLLARAKNKKNNLYKIFKKSGSLADYRKYSLSRASYITLNKLSYNNYINSMRYNFKRHPKMFFKFVNSKKKTTGFPSSMKFEQNESNDDITISNLFADFFSTTYSDAPYNFLADYPYKITANQSISISTINISTIANELKHLKFSHDSGPDNIPSSILIKCADAFALPLSLLFNTSINTGQFPDAWKDSFIVPLFKSGNKSDIANYRGIAKLSIIPKIFEKIITDNLCYQASNLISPYQHGFQKCCSTTTNLLQLVTVIFSGFINQQQTDVIYTDFSKAFDKVNHLLLKKKLSLLGFTELCVKWIYSYLTNRKQTVRFNNVYSKSIDVLSGVPQGSHLGPLLFSLFINDLPDVICSSHILMYADDVKLFLSYRHSSDQMCLQNDLNAFHTWCKINLMELNLRKCKFMRFSRKTLIPARYVFDDYPLEAVDTILDLGILLDVKLNFIAHITMTVNKARAVLGFVKRWSKEFNDPYVAKSLYTSLVRPILEYGSIIWDPLYKIHSDAIESVQKQFLLFCLRGLNFNPMDLPSYQARLALIKLPSLKSRRTTLNITMLFKIITGEINSGFLINNITFNVPQRPSRYFSPLSVQFCRSNYANSNPLWRMCNEFNKFYRFIDFSLSSITIKNNIIIYLNF